MNSYSEFFKDNKCICCAKECCNELCLHYGKPKCIKTLMQVGEELYLSGQEDLGVKYYAMAELAKSTQGIGKARVAASKPIKKKIKRKRKNVTRESLADDVCYSVIKRGVFGMYKPTPVSRSAAMSFQKRR